MIFSVLNLKIPLPSIFSGEGFCLLLQYCYRKCSKINRNWQGFSILFVNRMTLAFYSISLELLFAPLPKCEFCGFPLFTGCIWSVWPLTNYVEIWTNWRINMRDIDCLRSLFGVPFPTLNGCKRAVFLRRKSLFCWIVPRGVFWKYFYGQNPSL